MKRIYLSALLAIASIVGMQAQEVDFEEYTLDNGLHVILHQDNSAPVVVTAVQYHVGAKNENPERTGFAHFFEHLLFEGTENIERGKWFEIVSSNGGTNNAYTTDDLTYYYEVFPSNNLELGLWMESERLFQPVINQIGVDTQNEVVKEEKRLRIDNQPYGNLLYAVKQNLFTKHPYRWATIGSMDHLDAATLEEFIDFKEKFYVPNNAVLVVAGDINPTEVRKMVDDYFGTIPRGKDVDKVNIKEEPITKQIDAKYYDGNIQLPALIHAYRTPGLTERDAHVLNMVSELLSGGKSSRLYKKMVDENKSALEVAAINLSQEDYGSYITFAIPMEGSSLEQLTNEIDEEIVKLQTDLISKREFEMLLNTFENRYVQSNSSIEGIASSLAGYYTFQNDVSLINSELELYRSITPEEIREVTKKYLNPNQRLRLEYLPEDN